MALVQPVSGQQGQRCGAVKTKTRVTLTVLLLRCTATHHRARLRSVQPAFPVVRVAALEARRSPCRDASVACAVGRALPLEVGSACTHAASAERRWQTRQRPEAYTFFYDPCHLWFKWSSLFPRSWLRCVGCCKGARCFAPPFGELIIHVFKVEEGPKGR